MYIRQSALLSGSLLFVQEAIIVRDTYRSNLVFVSVEPSPEEYANHSIIQLVREWVISQSPSLCCRVGVNISNYLFDL